MKIPKDLLWILFLLTAFASYSWLLSESTRGMTLICVKVITDKKGFPAALEECR